MRRFLAICVAVIPWGVVGFVLWYCEPWGKGGTPGTVVRVLNWTILASSFPVGFACWVFSLSVLIPRKRSSPPFVARLNAGLLLLTLPIGLFFALPHLAFGRKILTSVQARDGRIYHLLRVSLWEQELGEEVVRNPLFLTTRVLCRTLVDNPYGQLLVWPANISQKNAPQFRIKGIGWPHPNASLEPQSTKLLFSTDGTKLAAIAERSPGSPGEKPYFEIYMLYDFQKHRSYGYPSMPGNADIAQVSPFILLGPDYQPNTDDNLAVCQTVEREGYTLAPFQEDLHSPNVGVRQATARMLGYAWQERKEVSPHLRKLAANDPDAAVRNEAKAALSRLQDLAAKHQSELSLEEQ